MKKALLLSSAAGLSGILPESIQRAFAIDPELNSTYLDAEHVVILMQENRSFDHCFGTLQGVRGFNDPRTIRLPDKNLAWIQTNAAGESYSPFKLDIKHSKITWMGALPHGRSDQVDAFNQGHFNQWLDAKKSRNQQYAGMPLTMGYYTREDIPFNYALADAFTVCDQHFCSAMTSTYPNRSYLWTGTIRAEQHSESKAHIRNPDSKYGASVWKTFPERLEDNGVSWKVYQNEIYCGGGFEKEERELLANLGCNTLEYFANYHVKFTARYVAGLKKQIETLPLEIGKLKAEADDPATKEAARNKVLKNLHAKERVLSKAKEELNRWSQHSYAKLSQKEKRLHQRAFTTNKGDPDYHNVAALNYHDGGTERQMMLPKGDILYQFREDVSAGKLPTVSWLVPPARFSDHPAFAWYGSWFVSEVLNILTSKPEVWKKTIFILTYDENDGYFDHIPPFVAPDPKNPETGRVSACIDAGVEYIRLEQDQQSAFAKDPARGGPIGLGYRVPMIIASPWSRGGQVCSQVFDHTSPIQFLERFLGKKLGREIKETNISTWRRTVCGDLTAAFNRYTGERFHLPFLKRDPFIEDIHKARFKKLPDGFKPLSKEDIKQLNDSPSTSPFMPRQEPGIRPSCALFYQLYAESAVNRDKKRVEIKMEAGNGAFGKYALGSPFNVYAAGRPLRSYAVAAGDKLSDSWALDAFENECYHLHVYGPNGFFREHRGSMDDPVIGIRCEYERDAQSGKLTGNLMLKLTNLGSDRPYTIEVVDNAYKKDRITKVLTQNHSQPETTIILDLNNSFGWYDFSISLIGFDSFVRRYAGRVETGENSYSDPAMGKLI